MPVLKVVLGDVVRMRKTHPCGNDQWEVVRLGADIGIRCLKCGRRVLMPRDYAPQGTRPEPGFAAGSELQIRVHIEAAALKPTGYRLYLFYL